MASARTVAVAIGSFHGICLIGSMAGLHAVSGSGLCTRRAGPVLVWDCEEGLGEIWFVALGRSDSVRPVRLDDASSIRARRLGNWTASSLSKATHDVWFALEKMLTQS
ncbi:hypothetical protein FIBSPDRAFT_849284 [Athelia psychrophila]|uniref:Uncharacterized protein n=1 Tax=Athelia psychrophila TaxID=1759441 RepID=A0A166UKD7_9AGAM|nr:hypothetical protein FIBSPDRAFT_849284 [Fibularhizoctonia sp. CBS 109695]